jgi:hypothetical protein
MVPIEPTALLPPPTWTVPTDSRALLPPPICTVPIESFAVLPPLPPITIESPTWRSMSSDPTETAGTIETGPDWTVPIESLAVLPPPICTVPIELVAVLPPSPPTESGASTFAEVSSSSDEASTDTSLETAPDWTVPIESVAVLPPSPPIEPPPPVAPLRLGADPPGNGSPAFAVVTPAASARMRPALSAAMQRFTVSSFLVSNVFRSAADQAAARPLRQLVA